MAETGKGPGLAKLSVQKFLVLVCGDREINNRMWISRAVPRCLSEATSLALTSKQNGRKIANNTVYK